MGQQPANLFEVGEGRVNHTTGDCFSLLAREYHPRRPQIFETQRHTAEQFAARNSRRAGQLTASRNRNKSGEVVFDNAVA